jgi:putative endonuclease
MITPPKGFFGSRKELGEWGERQALDFLKKKGLIFLDKNYHTRYGEIDLVLKNKRQIVFVEVKTRISKKFGWPEEAFDRKKRAKTELAIQDFLQKSNQSTSAYRLDLITIEVDQEKNEARLKHFESVD